MHQLLQALHQKLAALGQGTESLLGADNPISYRTKPPASIHRELLGVCNDPYTLAQQLTHVELVSEPIPHSAWTQSQEHLRTAGHPSTHVWTLAHLSITRGLSPAQQGQSGLSRATWFWSIQPPLLGQEQEGWRC